MKQLIFCCSEDNDLYEAAINCGVSVLRFDRIETAISLARSENVVLALADTYPIPKLTINESMLETARQKDLKLYLEYPLSIPNMEFAEPRTAEWERLVVTSDLFGPRLPPMTILTMHGCWFLPTEARDHHLVLARVAGYDKAVYGLPNQIHPILLSYSDFAIVATSKLSQFRKGRYAPINSWKLVLQTLLRWLTNGDEISISWNPTVNTAFSKDEGLPPDAENKAFGKSVEWFSKNALFALDKDRGVIEGYQSGIDFEGDQLARPYIRMDCLAEAALIFALDWQATRNPRSKRIAEGLLDYTWSFQYSDPTSPAYGLVDWAKGLGVFYGDDNARVILPTLSAIQILKDDKWDRHVAMALLANLRTTGALGFRQDRIDMPDLIKNGWAYYYNKDTISYTPHYQAFLWACFLWAFLLTGKDLFLRRTVNAIRMTMEVCPKWRWSNGISQEMGRMLLPLAFLIRTEQKAEYRKWIGTISDYVLEQQQPCGAIAEKVGDPKDGHYPPPNSNEAYATTEAPVIQENGDPASDLLYTANFTFLGLHELASASHDPNIRRAEDRLAGFLSRIQVSSERHRYLNGCWMRSFDYDKWEYWGSSSDLGWGAWCVESGWMNSWIASVFALRILRGTLFDSTRAKELSGKIEELQSEMFPAEK